MIIQAIWVINDVFEIVTFLTLSCEVQQPSEFHESSQVLLFVFMNGGGGGLFI